jgi:hypothetical protein
MNGNVAQIIALVSYGNSFLKNGRIDSFYPSNSTFQYCNRVDFRISVKHGLFFSKEKISVIAENPGDWYATLKAENGRRLRFRYRHSREKKEGSASDHILAGFVGGGGSWFIEAVYDDFSKYWSNYWDVIQECDPEDRIWSVTYLSDCKPYGRIEQNTEVSELKKKLEDALARIGEFASSKNLGHWAETFENAGKALNGRNPEEGFYHADLLAPDFYELESRQLLFAAAKAWVFGGMGSWNDVWFDDESDNEKHRKLSAGLFDTINACIAASLNAEY